MGEKLASLAPSSFSCVVFFFPSNVWAHSAARQNHRPPHLLLLPRPPLLLHYHPANPPPNVFFSEGSLPCFPSPSPHLSCEYCMCPFWKLCARSEFRKKKKSSPSRLTLRKEGKGGKGQKNFATRKKRRERETGRFYV